MPEQNRDQLEIAEELLEMICESLDIEEVPAGIFLLDLMAILGIEFQVGNKAKEKYWEIIQEDAKKITA